MAFMKRAWVTFSPQAWVGHVGVHRWWTDEGGRNGWRSLPPEEWLPPVRPIPGKGYPRIFVEFDDFVFEFISTDEIRTAASVLERKLVDRITSQDRWYRKLPAKVKAKHSRERVAAVLLRAASAYEAQQPEMVKACDGPVDLRL